MQSSMITSYEALRKADGAALWKRLRFAGFLSVLPFAEAKAAVEELASTYGTVQGVSKSTVSKMITVYKAYVSDSVSPADVSKRLVDIGKAEAGISTLYRALKAANDDVEQAWYLLETGADIRGENRDEAPEGDAPEGDAPVDADLSAIMSAVHEARQRGVSTDAIVTALNAL